MNVTNQWRLPVVVCLALGAFLSATEAIAAEYSLESEIKVETEHEDNYRLEVENTESLTGVSVRPGFVAEVKEENWDVSLDTALILRRFDPGKLDTNDQDIRLTAGRIGERYLANLTAGLLRDTTRTSEELDSGIIGTAQRHENYSLGASTGYFLTETNRLDLSVSGLESKYDAADRSDYDYYQGQLGWTHTYSDPLSLSLGANASRVEYEPIETTIFTAPLTRSSATDSVGWTLGAGYRVNEKYTLSSQYGQSDTTTDAKVDDPQGVCSLFLESALPGVCSVSGQRTTVANWQLSLDREGERHDFSISYSNRLQPSSDGVVLESERLSLLWKYRVSQRSNLWFEALWGENQALGASGNTTASRGDRTYANGSLRYSHRLNRRWSIFTVMAYRYQDRKIIEGDADSARLLLGISYTPNKKTWSR